MCAPNKLDSISSEPTLWLFLLRFCKVCCPVDSSHLQTNFKRDFIFHNKSSGVFDVIADILKPGLTVGKLVTTTKQYYDEVGIWSDAGWVGGYELGIGFPPDWVGNYVYEMSDTDSEKVFEPGTCVNFESQFFSPRMSGITYYICTLLFKEHTAELPVQTPRQLVVLD